MNVLIVLTLVYFQARQNIRTVLSIFYFRRGLIRACCQHYTHLVYRCTCRQNTHKILVGLAVWPDRTQACLLLPLPSKCWHSRCLLPGLTTIALLRGLWQPSLTVERWCASGRCRKVNRKAKGPCQAGIIHQLLPNRIPKGSSRIKLANFNTKWKSRKLWFLFKVL